MTNGLTHLNIHFIFAVNVHPVHFSGDQKQELQQFVRTCLQARNEQFLAMAVLPDHMHLLVDVSPDTTLSDLTRDVKARTTRFINRQKWIAHKFSWQKGYGAFSFGQSQVETMIRFIRNQGNFHSYKNFRQEYQEILSRHNASDIEKYLFAEIL